MNVVDVVSMMVIMSTNDDTNSLYDTFIHSFIHRSVNDWSYRSNHTILYYTILYNTIQYDHQINRPTRTTPNVTQSDEWMDVNVVSLPYQVNQPASQHSQRTQSHDQR